MASDPERATAIENSVNRSLRFAAEEVERNPDRAASSLSQATTQLNSDAAREHLSAETMERLRAQVAAMQVQVEASERAEKAGRIEREIKRFLSAAEEEIRTSGYQAESYVKRAADRLDAAETRECMTADTAGALQRQIVELQTKLGVATAAEPIKPVAPPASREPVVPAAPAAAPSAPVHVPPVVSGDPEKARLIQSDIERTIRFAAGDIDGPGWQQTESRIARAAERLQSDEARENLPAETIQRLGAQVAELQSKYAAHERAEHSQRIEDWIGRLMRDAENHVDWSDRVGGMLEKVTEVLESEDARKYLSAEKAEGFRRDIARIETMVAGTQKQKAVTGATEPLEELERRTAELSFEGMEPYEAEKLASELEIFRSRADREISSRPDDADMQALRVRLTKVESHIAAAFASAQRNRMAARVTAAFDEANKEIAGWEEETQDTSASVLGEQFLPKTVAALGRFRLLLTNDLFSPIPEARTSYPDDAAIQAIITNAERMHDAMAAKLAATFDAIMQEAEKLPTPSNKFDRGKASFMADKARWAFEHTPYMEARVARAKALDEKWEAAIEAENAAYAALYAQLSTEAAAAWPAIVTPIAVDEGFDPFDPSWKGKTVRISGVYNRIGWDFSGPFDYAVWVNGMPIVGNFEPSVRAAVEAAVARTRTSVDDHSNWDAIVVVGGPGKIKQRFKLSVKNKGNLEVGTIEEWRPVDCVMCKVIALHAGPVAVGPA